MNAKANVSSRSRDRLSTIVGPAPQSSESDAQVEAIEIAVAKLLRFGTIVSTILIAAGLLLILLQTAPALGSSLVTWGLVALVATPLLRVGAALIIYLKLGDIVYTIISLIVLLVVFTGMILGQG